MDIEPKIHLSSLEMDLVNNAEWILTKNQIVKKAQRLLGEVQQHLSDHLQLHPAVFPREVIAIAPKISKGENYKGLPWLMLDYPRYFDKENILAIRTLFWWGNFFSSTLHLAGRYKLQFEKTIINSYDELCKNEYYVCVNREQWHHDFQEANYLPVKKISTEQFAQHVQANSFIKLSKKLSLAEWDNAIQFLSENLREIIKWLG